MNLQFGKVTVMHGQHQKARVMQHTDPGNVVK